MHPFQVMRIRCREMVEHGAVDQIDETHLGCRRLQDLGQRPLLGARVRFGLHAGWCVAAG